jgi:hypothetical protein
MLLKRINRAMAVSFRKKYVLALIKSGYRYIELDYEGHSININNAAMVKDYVYGGDYYEREESE